MRLVSEMGEREGGIVVRAFLKRTTWSARLKNARFARSLDIVNIVDEGWALDR